MTDTPPALRAKTTTGQHSRGRGHPRSENSHFWGHCSDIAEQVFADTRRKDEVATALLLDAGDDGYPVDTIGTHRVPQSWALATGAHADMAISAAHHFADLHELWLTEYLGEVATKVYYGKEEKP